MTTTANPDELKVAEALLAALYELNRVDPDNTAGLNSVYASDNTSQATTDPAVPMSPYAHVRAALLFCMTRVAGGDAARGEQLLAEAFDNFGDGVPHVLGSLAQEWAQEDRAGAVLTLLRQAGYLEIWCEETGNYAPDLDGDNYDLRMVSAAVDAAGMLDLSTESGRARSALAVVVGALLHNDAETASYLTVPGPADLLSRCTTHAATVVSELGTPTGYERTPDELARKIRDGVPVDQM